MATKKKSGKKPRPKTKKPETLPPEKVRTPLSQFLPPEQRAVLSLIDTSGKGIFYTLQQMRRDIAMLENMKSQDVRRLLGSQLDVLALSGNQNVIELFKLISDPETDELTREVLLGRLGKFSSVNESVSRQRLALSKVEFIDDMDRDQGIDPADLSLDDWERQHQPRLLGASVVKQ